MQARNDQGFTLIHLLLVMGIAVVLTGIAVGPIKKASNKVKVNKAEAEIEMMGRAIEQIEEDTENYLEYLDQLDDATSPGASFSPWWGPYVSSLPVDVTDPWNNDYVYFFWETAEEAVKQFQLGNFPPGPPGGGWDKGEKKGWEEEGIPPGLWKKLVSEADIPERGFLLLSLGPDGTMETQDDIEFGTY